MRLDVLIQCHPARRERADALAHLLAGHVVTDPDPAAGANPWRCYAACLRAASPYAWTVIVQDDAEPHPDLRSICTRVVQAHPRRLVCLYHGRVPQNNAIRMMQAREHGLAYAEVRAGRYVPSVALLWPPHLVTQARLWMPRHACAADDEMISRLLSQHGHDSYLIAVPSLVDHDDTVPSLMGTQRRAPRTAILPPPGDAAACDWESGVLAYHNGKSLRGR